MGYSPTPRQHFWKTAAPKNFLFACGSLLAVMRFWCNVSCETLWIAPRKTTRNWFGKAGAHPQLALGIAIAPETLFYHYSLLIFEGNCDSFDPLLDFCCNLSCSLICSANVGCSPTPRQHFWKIVGSKNFYFACGIWYITHFEKQKQKKPWFQQLKVCWNQGKNGK